MNFQFLPLALLALLALLPPALQGQELLAAAEPLERVEVSGHHYDNAIGSSDAASQGVVRAELLKVRPLLRPGEVLETVPGLVVTQHSGDGKANQYFLRGFNLDHGTDFATTVNGMPVNMPTNAHGQGYSDLNFLIPELVDRIDYRKGPYFAKNGDFSAAGSADVAYRTTLEAPFAQATLGGEGYRRLLGAGSAAVAGGNTLLGALEVMRDDGPWTLKEGLRRTNGLLTLAGGSSAAGWSTSLMGYDAHWTSTDQVPQRLISAGSYLGRPFGRFDAVDPSDGGQSSRASLSAEWHDTDAGGARTQVSGFALHDALKLFSNFTYRMDRPETGDQFSQSDDRNVFGLQASRSFDHGWGPFAARSEVGLQWRHDRIHVGLFDTQDRQLIATTRVDDVRETLLAAYAQTAVEFTPWLRGLFGLRADRVDAHVDSLLEPRNTGSAGKALLSPKLSLVLGPWSRTEFFVNTGSGFHSNDARGMTTTADPKTGEAQQRVPGLVRARGSELGLRTEIVPGLQSSLALWRLDFASELTYSGDAGTTAANGPSRRYGLEWNNHWVPQPWLLLDLDLAWTHARFKDNESDGITTGPFVPNSVDRVFTGTVTLKDLGPWTVSLTERYIGAGALTADNSVRSSASLVSNLRVSRKFSTGTTLSLDVLNLFDRRYNDIEYDYATQLKGEAAPVNDKVVHPGEPRTVRLTLRQAF
ncbi:TonB-dependent receptor [Roseateles saccharophilus]|nr:TonB-dependent receptor [Roseateles saccharophilus]